MPKLADILPPRVRQAIYVVLGVAVPLEGIWDLLPDVWEGKVLATVAALGFGLAAVNTPTKGA